MFSLRKCIHFVVLPDRISALKEIRKEMQRSVIDGVKSERIQVPYFTDKMKIIICEIHSSKIAVTSVMLAQICH